MSKGWTKERRKKQAERIRQQKPWEKSTGPKSDAGKKRSSQNSLKHGLYGVNGNLIKAMLERNQEFLELYALFSGGVDLKNALERTERKFNRINARAVKRRRKR